MQAVYKWLAHGLSGLALALLFVAGMASQVGSARADL